MAISNGVGAGLISERAEKYIQAAFQRGYEKGVAEERKRVLGIINDRVAQYAGTPFEGLNARLELSALRTAIESPEVANETSRTPKSK